MADQNINNMTVTWNSGGTTFAGIKLNVTDTASAAASLLVQYQVGGSDKFKVGKDGTVTAAGNLLVAGNATISGTVLGNPVFSGIPVLTGGALSFPAVQVPSAGANVLDDYEEATYTPAVTATTGAFSSVTAISGAYTKIGRLVVFTALCTLTTIGTASGNILISLPFTAGSGTWIGAGRVVVGSGAMLQWVISSGGTTAAVLNYNNTSAIVAGAQIIITGSYWV